MGQGRACTMEAKALSVHPSNQGVCGRHGMEDGVATHGDLVLSEDEHRHGPVYKLAEVEIVVRVHFSQTSTATQ